MPSIWVATPVGAQKIPNNLHQTVWFHRKPKKHMYILLKSEDIMIQNEIF